MTVMPILDADGPYLFGDARFTAVCRTPSAR